MGRRYEVVYNCATVTAAQTLIYITAPSTKALKIVYASCGVSDVDTNEQTYACLQRITSVGSPTATSITPSKLSPGDVAASFTAAGDVTASEPSYTSDTQVGLEAFPMIAGFRYAPPPGFEMEVAPSASIGLRLLGAISSSSVPARIVVEEIG